MQKEFSNSCEGFLRAELTVPCRPGPVWKIAKMALFDPCMEFEFFLGQMTSFQVLLKCHSLTLSKKCLRLHPAQSKWLSERINWIISTIPHRITKFLFVYGSTMCWHKDIAKFQILLKIILNQPLGIQYGRTVANLHFLCSFNENLIDLIMTLLGKNFVFCQLYIVKKK